MGVASRTEGKPRKIAPRTIPGSNDDQSKIPRPKSLLKVQEAETYISAQDIRALAAAQYQSPAISLYLRFNADKVVPRGTALLRFFHSMKDRALGERSEWIESLSKSQKRQLRNDLDEIEAFLSNHSFPEGFRSEMIFKSGEELNRVITLPVRMSDNLTIDVDPYVMPLEIALEENERVLFVEISWNESGFLLYHLGYCQDLGRIKPSIPVRPVDGDTRDAARRRLTHSEWHLKNTARRAYDLCGAQSCQTLILMGEDRTAHFLESYLHESLMEKIIGRIYRAPATDHRSRKELIENNLREYKTAKEVRAIEELRNYKPGDELACGLRDVVEACNLFLMRKLFAADGVPAKGFLCAEHHYLSFADQECPFCHKKLLQVESLLDELVEVSRSHGVSINIFEYEPNLLAEYEGVAALLYPSADLA